MTTCHQCRRRWRHSQAGIALILAALFVCVERKWNEMKASMWQTASNRDKHSPLNDEAQTMRRPKSIKSIISILPATVTRALSHCGFCRIFVHDEFRTTRNDMNVYFSMDPFNKYSMEWLDSEVKRFAFASLCLRPAHSLTVCSIHSCRWARVYRKTFGKIANFSWNQFFFLLFQLVKCDLIV